MYESLIFSSNKLLSKYCTNCMGYWVTWFYSSDKPALPASRGRTLHQWRRGLVFWFNSLRRLHASGSGVSSSQKLINFMHFHNSYTQNCDHHILLIMTSNAHKESCHKLSLCLSGRKDWNTIKTDGSGQMVVAFTIAEINYLVVSLFWDVELPLSYLYLWYLVLRLRYSSCFRHSGKCGYGFPKINHHISVGAHQTELFSK